MKLTAIKGMNDILPPESEHWEWLETKLRTLMRRYGYRNIRTPIVESTALFVRGLGEVTDIVEKEMYSFTDSLNNDQLSLRPENTAGVVRAVNEHSLLYDGGKRLYYIGPMFRHERPQKGRYRQFHQVGAEALGFCGPDVDAEMIQMCAALWRDLGLTVGEDVSLQLNSLGQPHERAAHRQALIKYFEEQQSSLDEDARRRLHSNPLRILDSKNPAMQALIEQAPKLLDYLGAESMKHFESLQAMLQAAGVGYVIQPRLVRGMDYYNLTVFEWVTTHLGAQGTVCGGGRFDGLIEQLGGKPAPAVGWGLGLERLLLLLGQRGLLPEPGAPDAYAIVSHEGSRPRMMQCIEALRAQGVNVLMHAGTAEGPGSLKSQFKRADASGARWALIFADEELAQDKVSIKPLRFSGEQAMRPLSDIAAWAHELKSAVD